MIRRNNSNHFVRILNAILLIIFVCLGIVFFIISMEDKKDNQNVDFYSIKEYSKEERMFKNELPKKPVIKEEVKYLESIEDDFLDEDPELTYAKKLFEKSVNSKLKTLFKKTFNYKEGSYCLLEVQMKANTYKVKDCNSDSIFKREIEIGIDKMKPFKRKVYNDINLNNKKVIIKLNMD